MEIEKICIELLEGTKTLVPIGAELLNNGNYRILTNKYLDLSGDATSIWKFFPGDTVKCEIRDGELVATEVLSSVFCINFCLLEYGIPF